MSGDRAQHYPYPWHTSQHGAARLIFWISEAFFTDIGYLHLTTLMTESYVSHTAPLPASGGVFFLQGAHTQS